MKISRTTSYRIDIADKPGAVLELIEQFGEHKVDMAGLWGFGTGGGKAQLVVVPKDEAQFKKVVTTLSLEVTAATCFRVSAEDRVGALLEVLGKVKAKGINLHAIDAVACGGEVCSYLWSDPADAAKLGQALGA